MKLLNSIWRKILGLLYPHTCVFCGKVSESSICDACKDKVFYVCEPRCKKCGKPIRYEEQEYCHDCHKQKSYYEQGKSIWIHKGLVPWSVYQFKYHNRRIFGEFYAREMYRLYEKWIRDCGIELIVPIPLHKKRRRRRGYNQAEIVARYLSQYTGIPMDSRAVARCKYTKPQKALNHQDRKKNVKDVFEVRAGGPVGKRILLVDDIYTTGSTINEISKEFLEKGHNKVWFLTISIGQDF